jgi:hypothetical protein
LQQPPIPTTPTRGGAITRGGAVADPPGGGEDWTTLTLSYRISG